MKTLLAGMVIFMVLMLTAYAIDPWLAVVVCIGFFGIFAPWWDARYLGRTNMERDARNRKAGA